MTAAIEGGEGSAARPGRTLPPGKIRYPFYRRLVGPQGCSGRGGKSRPHRDSIPDRPASSQSLYWLSYPAHNKNKIIIIIIAIIKFTARFTCEAHSVFSSFSAAHVFSLKTSSDAKTSQLPYVYNLMSWRKSTREFYKHGDIHIYSIHA